MTKAIELGQRSQWRHTASLSTTEAHDLAARLASRARAEDDTTSSRYVRSGTGHRVPCPRSTLVRARRTTMRLYVAYALRARRPQAAVVARDTPRPGPATDRCTSNATAVAACRSWASDSRRRSTTSPSSPRCCSSVAVTAMRRSSAPRSWTRRSFARVRPACRRCSAAASVTSGVVVLVAAVTDGAQLHGARPVHVGIRRQLRRAAPAWRVGVPLRRRQHP